MSYYASNNKISTAPLDGGIEITAAQYQEALAAMQNGFSVALRAEGLRLLNPNMITIYDETGAQQSIAENDDIPDGWSAQKPIIPLSQEELITLIKQEAGRRISKSGHDWMAARQITTNVAVPQEIIDYAIAVRAASAALEADPKADYDSDQYWPQEV